VIAIEYHLLDCLDSKQASGVGNFLALGVAVVNSLRRVVRRVGH